MALTSQWRAVGRKPLNRHKSTIVESTKITESHSSVEASLEDAAGLKSL